MLIPHLYLSDDYGDTWSVEQPSGAGNKLYTSVSITTVGLKAIVSIDDSFGGGNLYLKDNILSGSWYLAPDITDINLDWRTTAISKDGQIIIAGVLGGRLYLSRNGGASWSEIQPDGDDDKQWLISAIK